VSGDLNFFDWMVYGIENGWCSDIVCDTHDGLPHTEEEAIAWDLGDDPCLPAVRIWYV